jgi:hypothetical protein
MSYLSLSLVAPGRPAPLARRSSYLVTVLPGGGEDMMGACMVCAAAKPVAPRRMIAADRVFFILSSDTFSKSKHPESARGCEADELKVTERLGSRPINDGRCHAVVLGHLRVWLMRRYRKGRRGNP